MRKTSRVLPRFGAGVVALRILRCSQRNERTSGSKYAVSSALTTWKSLEGALISVDSATETPGIVLAITSHLDFCDAKLQNSCRRLQFKAVPPPLSGKIYPHATGRKLPGSPLNLARTPMEEVRISRSHPLGQLGSTCPKPQGRPHSSSATYPILRAMTILANTKYPALVDRDISPLLNLTSWGRSSGSGIAGASTVATNL